MAVARPQAAGGLTGLKVALIVFVVVTVASLTVTVILYTQQSELVAAAQEAKDKSRRDTQTARDAKADLAAAATEVLGEPIDDVARIKEAVALAKRKVLDDDQVKEAGVPADSSLLTVQQELHALFSAKVRALEQAGSQLKELNEKLNAALAAAKASEQAFETRTDELKKQYETLEGETTAFRDKKNQELEELRAGREADLKAVGDELKAERLAREQTDAALKQEQQRNAEILAQLAAFKPSEGEGSLLQIKDGSIVRSFATEDVVYIDLGQREGVKRGMTFSVYSATGGIPADGKGKAAIEVAHVFDTTSECRVTAKTRGEPILEGDVIANPVFDRYRQFRFSVTGDFDLNFDGQIEDPGGKQVAQLIARWGGKVVDQVDTRTDFVVLGAPPPAPKEASPEKELTDAERERSDELKKNIEAFEAVKKEAKALSIPILTRTQFLHFLGYGVPKNTPDDQPPL